MTADKLQPADIAAKPAAQDPATARRRRIRHFIYILLIIGIAIFLFAMPHVASA